MGAQVLPKSRSHPRILRCQIIDMKQFPYWGRTNVGPPLHKIYSPGSPCSRICASLGQEIQCCFFCKIWGNFVTQDRAAVFSITTPCGLAEEIPPTRCHNAIMYNSNVDWASTPRASSAWYLHKHPSLTIQAVSVFLVVIFGKLEKKAD
jgi:hypothetical protein